MTSLHDVFEFFRGNWEFNRSYTGAQTGTALGHAFFTGSNQKMFYREEGTLSVNETNNPFTRHFDYVLETDRIDVFYADGPDNGKLYQSYELAENGHQLTAVKTHICGADFYTGAYNLIDENTFTLTTQVKGPQKDYTMTTEFKRVL